MNTIDAEEWKAEERRHHDEYAEDYLYRYRDYYQEKKFKGNLLTKLDNFYSSQPSDLLLDCGSGPGLETLEFCQFANSIVALDISYNMLKTLRQKAAEKGVASKIKCVVGDIEQMPFKNSAFDFVNVRGTLHHIPQIDQGLLEALRCLRSGGRIVVGEPNVSRCRLVDLGVKVIEKIGKIVLKKQVASRESIKVGTTRERPVSGKRIYSFLKSKGISGQIYHHTNYPYSFQIFGERVALLITDIANLFNNLFGRGDIFYILGTKSGQQKNNLKFSGGKF